VQNRRGAGYRPCRRGNGVAAFLREIDNAPDRKGDAPGGKYRRAKSDPSGGAARKAGAARWDESVLTTQQFGVQR